MKQKIINILIIAFFAGSILNGCNYSDRKVEDLQADGQKSDNNIQDANYFYNPPQQDTLTDFQKFRNESNEKINIIEKKISDLKLKIAGSTKGMKIKYRKEVASLELKTAGLKKNLKDYKEDNKDNWVIFKSEFNKSMDDLNKSMSNFFSNENKQ